MSEEYKAEGRGEKDEISRRLMLTYTAALHVLGRSPTHALVYDLFMYASPACPPSQVLLASHPIHPIPLHPEAIMSPVSPASASVRIQLATSVFIPRP